jgi:hypothetical protein
MTLVVRSSVFLKTMHTRYNSSFKAPLLESQLYGVEIAALLMLSWLEVRRSAQGCRVQCRTFVTTVSIYPFGAGVGYMARLSLSRGDWGRHCPDIRIECSVRIATQPSRRGC